MSVVNSKQNKCFSLCSKNFWVFVFRCQKDASNLKLMQIFGPDALIKLCPGIKQHPI